MADQTTANGIVTNGYGSGTTTTNGDVKEGWTDFLQVQVPQLFLRGQEEQVDFLLLAWALLLYRERSGDSDDSRPAFKLQPNPRANRVSSTESEGLLSLGSLFQSDYDELPISLDVIRSVRRKVCPNIDLSSEDTKQSLFLSSVGTPDTAASEVCLRRQKASAA